MWCAWNMLVKKIDSSLFGLKKSHQIFFESFNKLQLINFPTNSKHKNWTSFHENTEKIRHPFHSSANKNKPGVRLPNSRVWPWDGRNTRFDHETTHPNPSLVTQYPCQLIPRYLFTSELPQTIKTPVQSNIEQSYWWLWFVESQIGSAAVNFVWIYN